LNFFVDDTIAAVATASGVGGIGIVRISGPEAMRIARDIFRSGHREAARSPQGCQRPRKDALDGTRKELEDSSRHPEIPHLELASYRMHYGYVRCPEAGTVLDEVLLAVMRSPHSYTREDVVEIQAHGSPAALEAILHLVLRHGARLAAPGEFTRRAFLNGRIDLTQAEALIDQIHARSAQGSALAAAQMRGMLGDRIRDVRKRTLELLAQVEASIDFYDEAGSESQGCTLASALHLEVLGPLTELIGQADRAQAIREGVRVALVGPPNAGKSSLMNALLGRKRCIVAPVPGTTRDTIEETLPLEGYVLVLSDTAGLGHVSDDPVEALGIGVTWEVIEQSQIVLLVMDASQWSSGARWDVPVRLLDMKVLVVANKMDLVKERESVVVPPWLTDLPCFPVSALTGRGLEGLRRGLLDVVSSDGRADGLSALPNLRHKVALERVVAILGRSLAEGVGEWRAELLASDLSEAVGILGEITGESASEEVLNEIFSTFCVGK